MKTCTKCGETKPESEFHKDSTKRDKLASSCKACMRVANAKRYAASPEKKKEYSAKWYAANTDKHKEYGKSWREKNPDKCKAMTQKWFSENPEARRIYVRNRRAINRATGKLSTGIAAKLLKLQRGKCACGCGQPLGDDYHLDHIMPLALGGTNTDDNIQLLRSKCNLQKHAKHPVSFMQERGFLL